MGESGPILLNGTGVYVGYAAISIGQHLQPESMEPTCLVRARSKDSSLR